MVLALTPLALKPAPVTVTPEMVTLEFPLLVSVTGNPLLPPTFTLPKLRLVGLAPSKNVATTPVPLKARVRGEPGALLTSDTEPVTLPAAVGVNPALNVVLAPAAIVCGTLRPVMLKPVPVTVACEIVALAVPVFFKVIVCEALFPVMTLPKLALDGVAESCACTPVPLRARVRGEPGALLVMETLPLALPVAAGEYVAVNEVLCPGLRVSGAVMPLMVNPVPDTLAAEMVTLAVPEFVNVIGTGALLPTSTLPKLTLAGLGVSCPCTPVPAREMAAGELVALLVTLTLPVTLPVTPGANNTFSVTD